MANMVRNMNWTIIVVIYKHSPIITVMLAHVDQEPMGESLKTCILGQCNNQSGDSGALNPALIHSQTSMCNSQNQLFGKVKNTGGNNIYECITFYWVTFQQLFLYQGKA